MSIKRTTDPAGLMPDLVAVTREEGKGFSQNEVSIIKGLLIANTPRARVDRLKLCGDIPFEEIEYLEAELNKTDGDADWYLLERICRAESYALYSKAAPKVIRDNKRQDGTKKKKKNVGLNKWIEERLLRDPDLTNEQLWERLPEDQKGEGIIQFARFSKRIASIRKKIKGRK